MIDELPYEELSAGELLRRTGISKGSLYHHFEDYSDVLEAAYLRRFFINIETAVASMEYAMDSAATKDELFAHMRELTQASQDRARAPFRFERARLLGKAERNDRFRVALGAMQQRQTDAFAAAISRAQEKGWVRTDIQARTIAVFIQAYSLGRIIDDITENPMDDEDWNNMINLIAEGTFGA